MPVVGSIDHEVMVASTTRCSLKLLLVNSCLHEEEEEEESRGGYGQFWGVRVGCHAPKGGGGGGSSSNLHHHG